MKKYFPASLILAALVISSCLPEEKDPIIIDNQIDLYFQNHAGQDLFDTTVVGNIRPDSIHLYAYIDGVKHELIHNVNYPRGFLLLKNEIAQKFLIRIFPETEFSLIELNAENTDTLTCTIEKTDRSLIITKVLYNGNVRWEDRATPRELTVVK